MHVVCCQLDIAWEDKRANCEKVRCLLAADPPGAKSLVVLPEMFATGFSMDVAAVREDQGGRTESFLAGLAEQYGVFVLGGLVAAGADGRGRNEAVAFSPAGREIARYCKMHPFSPAGEENHYSTGQRLVCFRCEELTAAPFICYDLRFPEAFRRAAREGAQLLVVIANWPAVRQDHWTTLLRARAIENQAYVAGVNRCGRDPQNAYCGGSMIVDPQGRVLAQAGAEECVISADLDLDALLDYRKRFPALDDIRPDLLGAG